MSRYPIAKDFKKIDRPMPYHRLLFPLAGPVQKLMLRCVPLLEGLTVSKESIPGFQGKPVPVELYRPAGKGGKLPCVLLFHGGGFGYRAAPYHKRLAMEYARRLGCVVAFPDYHLLPRYPRFGCVPVAAQPKGSAANRQREHPGGWGQRRGCFGGLCGRGGYARLWPSLRAAAGLPCDKRWARHRLPWRFSGHAHVEQQTQREDVAVVLARGQRRPESGGLPHDGAASHAHSPGLHRDGGI